FCHSRQTPADLNSIELGLRQLALFEFLSPAYSYLSVIEVSLYEVQAMAMRRLADRGLQPGTPEHDEALAGEMEKQKERMNERLFRAVPPQRYICFYPMNKRRGEHVNWYALPLKDRRAMMRGHGSIGHKYADVITQVIGGSTGLDDWEWGVSLHADDPLQFKKLIYEMRFDAASSWFAEFGPFYVGVLVPPSNLAAWLHGQLPQ
ncbi:MAG: chlorite dismutase family protein, partial [Candidatus Binatia bacterium]